MKLEKSAKVDTVEVPLTGLSMTQKTLSKITIALLLTSLFALSSCGGGGSSSSSTGNPANTEVINGIAVPPEPNPTINNATIAGVDINNNGVRDDVERKIATLSNNDIDYSNNLLHATLYQARITNDTTKISAIKNKLACISLINDESVNLIKSYYSNNPERDTAIMQKDFEDLPTCTP